MTDGKLSFGLTVAATAWCVACAATIALLGAPLLAAPTAVGAVLCGIAWAGMHAVCARGSSAGKRVANFAAWSMLAVALTGALYGGLYVLPALGLLAAAAARVPHRTII